MSLRFIPPMQPVLVDEPPSGTGWIHEIKFDGYRTQLQVEEGKAKAYSRRGLDWSDRYEPIVGEAAGLRCRSAIIDGEMIVQDESGVSDFNAFRKWRRRDPARLVFMAFDLLYLDGEDLRPRPLEERRARLQALLAAGRGRQIAFSEALEGDGAKVFAAAESLELEGIVSKKLGSRYRSGDTSDWRKTKVTTVSTLDVLGIDRLDTGRPVAVLAQAGRYVGDAVIGVLTPELERAFWAFVETHKSGRAPAGLKRKGVTWIRPGLQAQVRHLRGEDELRHQTLLGLTIAKEMA
jgi:bifunctional non-homologous end joining protein LigD